MKNERGGILFRLLCLALLGWAGWFLYTRWWPENNLQRYSGRLESAVGRELTRQGVTDRDIINQKRTERSQWGVTWVETQRTLQLPDDRRVQDVSKGLAQTAQRLGCRVEKSSSPAGLAIRLIRFLFPMQRFTLVMSHAPPQKGNAPQVAFVIDDVAYETASMDRFAALGIPLTFAILPREKHAGELSRKATGLHFAVMLHLPMEPQDVVHNDPGPSALRLHMSDAELKTMFDKDVASVPNIVGINNHMGSAFTEDESKMKLVLGWVKNRNVYFLDSRTSGKSVGCKAAAEVGVPCLANQTFLDNEDSVQSIEIQLDQVIHLALKKGRTIAIGHYRRKHLVEALADKLPDFQSRGVQIVALPSFYHQ